MQTLDLFEKYVAYSLEETKNYKIAEENIEDIAINLYKKINDSINSLLELHQHILFMYLQGLSLKEMQVQLNLSVYEIKSDFYLGREDLLNRIDAKYDKESLYYRPSIIYLIGDHNMEVFEPLMQEIKNEAEEDKKDNAEFINMLVSQKQGILITQLPPDPFLFIKVLKFWDYKKNQALEYKNMITKALSKLRTN